MPTLAGHYLISFDFGLRHIGVAVGQTVTTSARGIGTLVARNGKPDWHVLKRLISGYPATLAIVGLPLNMDGTTSPMSQRASAFAKALTARCHLTVELHDERLTSKAARDEFEEAKSLGIAATEHELAACLILKSWLEEQA